MLYRDEVKNFQMMCKAMFCKSKFVSFDEVINNKIDSYNLPQLGKILLLINNKKQILKFHDALGSNPKNLEIYYSSVVRSNKEIVFIYNIFILIIVKRS